jgi:hypothetical protein
LAARGGRRGLAAEKASLKAVIVSAQYSAKADNAWGDLSPLVDRPFMQHVVESVVGQGIREVTFVLAGDDRAARRMLGDGTRWGARFEYCSTADKPVYDGLAEIVPVQSGELVLLAHSDRLPLVRLDANMPVPTLFCWRAKDVRWTGWGVIRTADLRSLPPGIEESGLFAFLSESCEEVIWEEGPPPLTARSFADLIQANRRVLMREFPGLLVGGKEVRPGVWVARNVTIHPTATLEAPAFLGENSRVGAMVRVGPATSIGKNCMIERDTLVADSVVCSGSYVGRQLALRDVVVDRSRLINTRWGAEIEGVDNLLLGSVFGTPFRVSVRRAGVRLAAAFAFVVALPFLLALLAGSALGAVPELQRRFIVHTPTVSAPYRWKTFSLWSFGPALQPASRIDRVRQFFFHLLPALPSVAAGHLGFMGEKPLSKEEIEGATSSERTSYLRSRCGILQLFRTDSGAAK